VWRQIKKLGKTIATRTFLFLGFLFTWVIPIYLLGESFALTKTVEVGWKLSFMGICVAVFCLIKFYGKIKAKIESLEPKTTAKLFLQFLLITLQKGLTFTAIGFFVFYLEKFLATFNNWYFASLIPIGIGLIFYLIDRVIMFKKKKAEAKAKVEKFKEQIKGELANGE
jgi:hypothetical protein